MVVKILDNPLEQKVFENFLGIDAGDGGGKGTLIQVEREYFAENKIPFFDCIDYWNSFGHDIPTLDYVLDMVPGCRALIVAEPTYIGLGKVIRDELIHRDSNARYSEKRFGTYTPHATAQAYSLDRDILYKKLVIDALDYGLHVTSDRGVLTSDVYQPLQARFAGLDENEFREYVRSLPGNVQALANLPAVFLLPRVETAERMRRLAFRPGLEGKDDCAIFELPEFQAALTQSYDDANIRGFYEQKGCRFVDFEVPTGQNKDVTKQKFRDEFWVPYAKSHRL